MSAINLLVWRAPRDSEEIRMSNIIDPIEGVDEQITADMLIEEVSIDGMCGVY